MMIVFMLRLFIPVCRKHVEVQVMGDGQDNYVHLGERNYYVQRKNQI